MNLKKWFNLHLGSFKLKFGIRHKPIHNDFYKEHEELAKRIQEQQSIKYPKKPAGV